MQISTEFAELVIVDLTWLPVVKTAMPVLRSNSGNQREMIVDPHGITNAAEGDVYHRGTRSAKFEKVVISERRPP